MITFLVSAIFADGVQPSGSGTESDPYQVETLDNLLWISTDEISWDKYFIQTSNIDATDTANWNNGAGFLPFGDTYNRFHGKLDGKGFVISNLFINRPATNYVGLFGASGNGCIVSNLGVINADITGNKYVGILIGNPETSNDEFHNCYVSGNVTGNEEVGGFVGKGCNSIFDKCYSTADVVGTTMVGGFVGGGAVADITDCYSTGNVDGSAEVGGFIGNDSAAFFTNCYSTGFVSGDSNVGGFGGYHFAGTYTDCFWDTETSGQATSVGGTGKTTTEMQDVATYTSLTTVGLDTPWDFVDNPFDDIGNEDYWDIDSMINDGYPYFANPYISIEENVIPELSWQLSNFPNPFKPTTTIEFSIKNNSNVQLSIYNTKGQKIKTLTNNEFTKGSHSVIWNGTDNFGNSVSSGIYFYKLNVNGKTVSDKKCLLLK